VFVPGADRPKWGSVVTQGHKPYRPTPDPPQPRSTSAKPDPQPDCYAATSTCIKEVEKRTRGASRVSSKHQVTIPVEALRAAGIEAGDRLVARADGPGRVVFEREVDVLAGFVGALTGVYEPDELTGLRDEWDSPSSMPG